MSKSKEILLTVQRPTTCANGWMEAARMWYTKCGLHTSAPIYKGRWQSGEQPKQVHSLESSEAE